MSDIMEINSLSQVTSVSDSDKLMVVTPEGFSKITALHFLNRIKSLAIPSGLGASWIRLGYITTEGCFIYVVLGKWGARSTQMAILAGQGHMSGGATENKVQNMLPMPTSSAFTKARMVKTNGDSKIYLDIYMSHTYSRIEGMTVCANGFTQLTPSLVSSLEANQTAYEAELSGGG